ncbi:MAG TPA: hypothetical protein PKK95_09380, partial [Vicinamibacterales bacterium]|nr:hypothetical protein [Vicinamibacterales bacterium]
MATSSPCFVRPLPFTMAASSSSDFPVRFWMFFNWVASALSRSGMRTLLSAGRQPPVQLRYGGPRSLHHTAEVGMGSGLKAEDRLKAQG